MNKGLHLSDKDFIKFTDLMNQTTEVGYGLEDLSELLNEKVNFDAAPPKPLLRRLRAKTSRVHKAISKVYDAIHAAEEAVESLDEVCQKLDLGR